MHKSGSSILSIIFLAIEVWKRRFISGLCSLLVVFILSVSVQAQNATMRGVISDREEAQPLEGANVVLRSLDEEDNFLGTAADRNGFYQISSIKPGRYQFRVTFIGYVAYEDTLYFDFSESRTVSVNLRTDNDLLGEVVVENSRGAALRDGGRQIVTPADINRVPTPVAGGDLVNYIQSLPGVVTLGSRGGQVFIRGGTPSENLVKVDGAVIYQPFHIVGFFSPFPDNLVSTADFYAGGFSPYYNGRISSVLDVRMRNGNRYEYGGSASVSPFLADVLVEGPISKGTSSWIFSARRSIIEETSPYFLPETQPLKFQSHFLKAGFQADEVQCTGMTMHTYDRGRIDFEKEENIRWGNFILSGQCRVLPEGSKTLLETNLSVSHLWNTNENNDGRDFNSRISQFNSDVNLTQYFRKIKFDYGMFMRMQFLNYDLVGKIQNLNEDSYWIFNLGTHFQASIPLGNKIKIEPGIVLSMHPGYYDASFEPRLRTSWRPFGRPEEEFSAVVGVYRQPLIGISDMRDASSVFSVWLRAPIGDKQMEALHVLAGWQQSIGRGFSWSLEGYYKDIQNIPVTVWSTLATFNTELALANGEVYGTDFRAEYNRDWFYGMIGYGYTWIEYQSAQESFGIWFDEPVQSYNPPHDRRHQVNASLGFEIGEFMLSGRWQLGSGLPYTRPIGFDEVLRFENILPNVRQNLGTRRVILDRPYEGRLPYYHRLDVSLERDFVIKSSGAKLNTKIGAINSYDRSNIFYYDVFTQRRIDQLPFVPYISLKIET